MRYIRVFMTYTCWNAVSICSVIMLFSIWIVIMLFSIRVLGEWNKKV